MSATIGSLFSGIGGLDLGLERAGLGPVLWQAEIDPFCRRVLEEHWPSAHRFKTVEEVNEYVAEPPTIIAGGFPCQDVSVAGAGAGLAGEHSGLWREFARIVRVLRPRIVVVENVAALLRRGMGDVLGDLAACGYDASWDCIPGSAIGSPQRRDRVFMVAWRVPDAKRDGVRQQSERGRGSAQATDRRHAEPVHMGAPVADAERERLQGEHEGRPATAPVVGGSDLPRWPPSPDDMHAWGRVQADAQPAFCRLADGLPPGLDWPRAADRRDAIKALGNAVIPDVAQIIGRVVVDRLERTQ